MASDVSATKPAGDVFASALEKLGHPASAIVVGDTVYDVASAAKLGLPCIGLHSGGIEEKLLLDAGRCASMKGLSACWRIWMKCSTNRAALRVLLTLLK